jgi:hypothetical protein
MSLDTNDMLERYVPYFAYRSKLVIMERNRSCPHQRDIENTLSKISVYSMEAKSQGKRDKVHRCGGFITDGLLPSPTFRYRSP